VLPSHKRQLRSGRAKLPIVQSSLATIGKLIAGKVMKAMIHISPPQRRQASGKAS
jgi:hypothetical protein